MPKEIVIGCHPIVADVEGAVLREGLVQVGWHTEAEYVAVVTMTRDAKTYDSNSDTAIHVDLDRRGINQLIRHLRRARDQAYGRDE